MKFTPKARLVRSRVRVSRPAKVLGFMPARAVPIMPRPPASETALAISGGAAAPIPACWIGTEQPTSFVNRVVSISSSVGRVVGRPRPKSDLVRHVIKRPPLAESIRTALSDRNAKADIHLISIAVAVWPAGPWHAPCFGQGRQHRTPEPAPRPPVETVVDSGARAVGLGAIAPATS